MVACRMIPLRMVNAIGFIGILLPTIDQVDGKNWNCFPERKEDGACSMSAALNSVMQHDGSAVVDIDDASEGLFTPGTLRIPRESNLSLEDYYKLYSETETPVIIQDYSSVFESMSKENILKVCGDVKSSAARRAAPKEGTWASIEWYHAGPLVDAFKEIEQLHERQHSTEGGGIKPGDEGSIIGVFDWSLQRHCPELLEQHMIVPKYFAQDYLQRIPEHVPLKYRDSWPSLFVGVNGTYGGNHRDVFGSSFWMYIIEGAKGKSSDYECRNFYSFVMY